MAIPIGSNFSYKGKLPNFDRDSFKTLSDMKAVADTIIDEGHISFCEATGKHYVFNSSNVVDEELGKWRLFGGTGDIDEETMKKILISYHYSTNNSSFDGNTTDLDIDGNDDTVDIDGGNFIESVNKYDLAKKVDKVNGKGLSTNDFTDEYKTKLDQLTISDDEYNAMMNDILGTTNENYV